MCRVPRSNRRHHDFRRSRGVPSSSVAPTGTCPSVRDPAPRTARRPTPMPAARALRYAQSGSTVTPRVRPRAAVSRGPGARGNSERRGLSAARSQAATRRWPTSLAFPATTASAAGPRMRAQDDAHQSGLAAATRPLSLVNAEAVRIPVAAPACRPLRASAARRRRRPQSRASGVRVADRIRATRVPESRVCSTRRAERVTARAVCRRPAPGSIRPTAQPG